MTYIVRDNYIFILFSALILAILATHFRGRMLGGGSQGQPPSLGLLGGGSQDQPPSLGLLGGGSQGQPPSLGLLGGGVARVLSWGPPPRSEVPSPQWSCYWWKVKHTDRSAVHIAPSFLSSRHFICQHPLLMMQRSLCCQKRPA